MKKPSAIDLFSGCGGLTLGLRQAGFDVISAIELSSLAAETYKRNHPETQLIAEDIRKVDPIALMASLGLKKGQLDLLAGCPPCQGFSTLRTNKKTVSVDDSRNRLMFNFLDFIGVFLPKTVMMENVPGLADGRRIKKFTDVLESLGYDTKFDILNVANYGVPQRRKRFILIASRIGQVSFAKALRKKVVVEDVLRGFERPSESNDLAHNHGEKRSQKVQKIMAAIPKNGGSRKSLPKNLQMNCHKNSNGFNDVYGRMSWSDVAPTITGGCTNPSKGRFLHPIENRTITVREAALLQGFPANYFLSMREGKGKAALMIGNALPPKFIKLHALEIKKALDRL